MGADSEGLASVSSFAMDFPFDFGHVNGYPHAFTVLREGRWEVVMPFSLCSCVLFLC